MIIKEYSNCTDVILYVQLVRGGREMKIKTLWRTQHMGTLPQSSNRDDTAVRVKVQTTALQRYVEIM